MKVGALLVAIAASALTFLPSASAATPFPINIPRCFFSGGHATLPAGQELVPRIRWVTTTRGLAEDYVKAQTTTLAIDAGAPIDLTDAYAPPVMPADEDNLWAVIADYATGITLAPGESVTVTVTRTLSHPIHDGAVFASDHDQRPFFVEGAASWVCTVTGA